MVFTLARGELLLCTPSSCLDKDSMEGFGVQVLTALDIFVRPTLDVNSSSLTFMRNANADQTLMLSFASSGQLPVSILPCMILVGWDSPIFCDKLREQQTHYIADLYCRVPANSTAVLQQARLQCSGTAGGYSPLESQSVPLHHVAKPQAASQSVFDLHVDAADLMRFHASREMDGADLLLLRLGLSLTGWEAESPELVAGLVEGCRLTRPSGGSVARRALRGTASALGVAEYVNVTNGSHLINCKFEVSSGIQDMVPWNDQEQPLLSLSLRFRSGLWLDTNRSITVRPRISDARALPSACADSSHCAVLVMGLGFTPGAASRHGAGRGPRAA
ncbi:unnamed protein product [Effrenium voratum]|nr:unnamed protein product [Effrenium voratum]